MSKTQILITDIPSECFKQKWPEQLEKELFEDKFPEFKAQLFYYTPLSFLNRIIIILSDEATTLKVFNYVHSLVQDQGRKVKMYLTESLLSKPRSKSTDDVSNLPEQKSQDQESRNDKPILSIDTNPLSTGVNSSSLSIGSPSLSPDRTCLESPTLLKFDNQSKLHYYKEPLPKLNRRESLNTSTSTDDTKYLFKPKQSSASMTILTNLTPSSTKSFDIPPPSPSITLNEFHH